VLLADGRVGSWSVVVGTFVDHPPAGSSPWPVRLVPPGRGLARWAAAICG